MYEVEHYIEEVPVKRIDRPSATETERDMPLKRIDGKVQKKHGNATEIDQM